MRTVINTFRRKLGNYAENPRYMFTGLRVDIR